jgi:hypothetical protein
VRDDPPGSSESISRWIFEWDAEALDERGEHRFVGLFTHRLADITDHDIDALDALSLPLVDYPPAGLREVRVSDIVRWARSRVHVAVRKPRSA